MLNLKVAKMTGIISYMLNQEDNRGILISWIETNIDNWHTAITDLMVVKLTETNSLYAT